MLAPRRIAFINEKGGSAKTTLVANLAAYLAMHRGRRVLAIDMDPQGQLGKVLGVDVHRPRRSAIDMLLDAVLGEPPRDPTRRDSVRGFDDLGGSSDPVSILPISHTQIPRLDVVVANKSLALAPALDADPSSETTQRLLKALERAPELDSYDFVFFDAPPSFGALTLNVLCAAQEIVVPVPLTYLAMDGCAELLRTVATVRTRYGNPDIRITMVVPTFYRRTKLAHEILDKLKARFKKEIAHTVVGYHVKIDEAQSRGMSIFEYAPRDRAAKVMAELAEELELRGHDPLTEDELAGSRGGRERP
ncbi:MAG: ParA family protein [Myxococcales bacterium]|nr:ParA family protein [Myxococcales bacterium]